MKKLWKNSRTLRENLQRRLPRLAAEYFQAGRTAMMPGTAWVDMHQFRLATKRFRYTLELFRTAYGPGLARRIDALKEVQTFLGDINDCVVADGMLADLPGMESVRTALGDKAAKKTAKLRAYWHQDFDGDGAEQRWLRYLGAYACRPKPLPRTRRIVAPAEATT